MPPVDAVPESWVAYKSHYPYVISITDKTHKVAIGDPTGPRSWRSVCGWALKASTKFAGSFSAERETARQRAGARVLEWGGRPLNRGFFRPVMCVRAITYHRPVSAMTKKKKQTINTCLHDALGFRFVAFKVVWSHLCSSLFNK